MTQEADRNIACDRSGETGAEREAMRALGISTMSAPAFLASWADHWDDVLASLGNANPFVTIGWLAPWWRHFGAAGREEVALVRDGQGAVQGAMFSEACREWIGGLPMRTIRPWVNSQSFRATILAPGDAGAVVSALLEHWIARRRKWDLLRLGAIPLDDPVAEALIAAAGGRGCPAFIGRTADVNRIVIDRPWPDFYRALPRKSRMGQERLERRLADRGACAWRKYAGDTVAAGLEHFFAVEARSWKQARGETIDTSPTLAGFFREMTARLGAKHIGEIDIYFFGGRPIAGVFSLVYGNRIFTLKTGFDEEFQRYSPGWLLFKGLLADAFERGLEEVDFCSRMPFTDRWSKDTRRYCEILVFAPTLRGRMGAAAARLLRR